MRHIAIIILACVCAATVFAQSKRPFTFEDMMKLKRVEEPEVSPNGKWVLFAAVDVDLATNTRTPHVWVVPLAGGQEKEIISDQDADRPRWAPDGKHFAFISTKEGGSQAWVADFDGAAGTVSSVQKLTHIATGASGELWSSDGRNILFVSNVYPECDGAPTEEEACNAKKFEAAEKSPVKALIFTHLLYRHWNAYKEGKRSHLFVVAAPVAPSFRQDSAGRRYDNLGFASLPAIPRDLTPGDYDAPPFSLGGQDNYAFSPDGQELCYASNHDKVEAISTNSDLWTVPVNAGRDHVGTAASAVQSGGAGQASVEPRSTRQPGAAIATQDSSNGYVAEILAQTKNITADNPAADETPLYSPDGKYIAYRAQQRAGYESDRWRLMLYDRQTGKSRKMTEKLDAWVGSFAWSPDSKHLFLIFEANGKALADSFSIDRPYERSITVDGDGDPNKETGNFQSVIRDGYNDDLAVSPDARTLAFTRMSVDRPNEILTTDVRDFAGKGVPAVSFSGTSHGSSSGGRTVAQLTHLNDALLSQVSMSPLESFWFTGAHGDKVEGFLVKPPNFDPGKKYPVKFLIHGGPQEAWGDDWSYRWNAELFAAPTSSSPGYVVIMINFHGSTGYGQKFVDSINSDWGGAPFEDLMKGLDYAEEHYGLIDKDRECALGASFGGYMINWVLGHTNRFKCLVSHDGTFNNESDYGTTEELWFNEWEFHGTPWENRELYRKWSPHLFAANFKTPTLVIHGQLDYRLDVSEGFQLFTTLQRLGVPSKMLYFPDEGHWVLKPQNSQLWYKTVNDWVDQWVGK